MCAEDGNISDISPPDSPPHSDRKFLLPDARAATVAQLKERSNANVRFIYVRMGSTSIIVSYKGNSEHNIENFQGLKIRFHTIVYQRKTWTGKHFLKRIRKGTVHLCKW